MSDNFCADLLKASKASSICFSSEDVIDTRIRALPLGTVGYRIACTKTPSFSSVLDNVNAFFSSPIIIGII